LKSTHNQMKKLVLGLLSTEGPVTSHDVARQLRDEHNAEVSIRAVQMALMRYHRQGLLHRTRRGSVFYYSLLEKGAKRLIWLRNAEAP